MGRQIRAYVSLGLHGCKIEEEFDLPDDWDEMSEKDREEHLEEVANEHKNNNCEHGAYVVDDEGAAP